MGMGSGLNAFLSLLEAERSSVNLRYITIESDPLTVEQASLLNYPTILNPSMAEQFNQIHASDWGQMVSITDNFSLLKLQGKIEELDIKQDLDLIYFDAFAPTVQPQLWAHPLHKSLYDKLNPGGILVTYCSKGSFRRCLSDIGYKVERLNGPGKKREMLRGTRPQ